MITYEFEQAGERRTVRCHADEIAEVSRLLATSGWRRVWSPPRFHLYPGYTEALEESEREAAKADAAAVAGRREGAALIREGLREEGVL